MFLDWQISLVVEELDTIEVTYVIKGKCAILGQKQDSTYVGEKLNKLESGFPIATKVKSRADSVNRSE